MQLTLTLALLVACSLSLLACTAGYIYTRSQSHMLQTRVFPSSSSLVHTRLPSMKAQGDPDMTPISPKTEVTRNLKKGRDGAAFVFSQVLVNMLQSRKANAIGDLYEFKEQSMVMQDVSFNVPDVEVESTLLRGLFVNFIRELRSFTSKDETVRVMSFGPDAYASPPTFIPGVGSFMEDGGHSTITLRSRKGANEEEVEIFEKGNGLQSIKIGSNDIRVSKAIDNGATIKYSYGWVELDTPGNVPLEVVVGYRMRDNIMCMCIRVTDMKATIDFLTKELGMQLLPYPLARDEGSRFEQEKAKDEIYVGYSDSSVGLLLRPIPKVKNKAPESLIIGSELNGFTIVVDDSKDPKTPLPAGTVSTFVEESRGGGASKGTKKVYSPDGYPFILKTYSLFSQEATKGITEAQ